MNQVDVAFAVTIALFTLGICLKVYARYIRARILWLQIWKLCERYDDVHGYGHASLYSRLRGAPGVEGSAFYWFASKIPSGPELVVMFWRPIRLTSWASAEKISRLTCGIVETDLRHE